MSWETLPHPTDLLVRVQSSDRRALFAEAVRATFASIATPKLENGWPRRLETLHVRATGDDELELLRRLLAECVFLFETQRFLARDVELESWSEKECRVRLTGARFEVDELDVENVVKAVTWHGLSIREDAAGASAEVLFDL
jgi:SHS2 domain-containing protein